MHLEYFTYSFYKTRFAQYVKIRKANYNKGN